MGEDISEQYHIALEQFSLEEFKHILETSRLLPSQRVLGEKLPERFATLEAMGIANLQDLANRLRSKKETERFSQESGLPQDYLTIMRRRIGFYTPKPVPLGKFPGIDLEHVERLAAAGIKQTRQLLERAASKQDRAELSRLTGVPADALLELVKLSDLARAIGVGPTWARLIYEAGIDTMEKLANSSAEDLAEKVRATNEEKKLVKTALPSMEDLASSAEIWKRLPKVIEY
jgi:predicted flap endonuclease-1-like 5' DNA nuclease